MRNWIRFPALALVFGITGGAGADISVLAGIELIGLEAEGREEGRDVIEMVEGDSLRFICEWRVTDRVADNPRLNLRLVSDLGSAAVMQEIGAGAPLSIGEVLRERVAFRFIPSYTHPPDLRSGLEHFELGLQLLAGGSQYQLENKGYPQFVLTRKSLFLDAVCVTGNHEPNAQSMRPEAVFSPEPILHSSAQGKSTEDELTDGLYSKSGNANWESIIWSRTPSSVIELRFQRSFTLLAVIVASPSPYPNRRLGSASVAVAGELGKRVWGEFVSDSLPDRRALTFLVVEGTPVETDVLYITLERSRFNGITDFAVSEVYVWGIL